MTVARHQLRWTVGVWCALMVVAMWITPGRAAEFRIAVGVDPDTLDPVQQTTTTVGNMVDYMVETLTKLVPDGSIQPPWPRAGQCHLMACNIPLSCARA